MGKKVGKVGSSWDRKEVGEAVTVKGGRKSGRTGTVIGETSRSKPLVQLENGDVAKVKSRHLGKGR